jgi:hypothetical protein
LEHGGDGTYTHTASDVTAADRIKSERSKIVQTRL